MNIGVTQIMWKEILIGFIVLYMLRKIWDAYLIKSYNKLVESYGNAETEMLKAKAKKHLKLCGYFSVGPWNKQIYRVYNGLCWLLASIELVENNEHDFLSYLNMVKKENEFEMKAFALSLYYRAKNNNEQAQQYYNLYLNSRHEDDDIASIMNYFFEKNESAKSIEDIVSSFQNPAIIKLIRENEVGNK